MTREFRSKKIIVSDPRFLVLLEIRSLPLMDGNAVEILTNKEELMALLPSRYGLHVFAMSVEMSEILRFPAPIPTPHYRMSESVDLEQ